MNLVARARLARLAVVSALSAAAASAQAALPSGIDTAISTSGTDANTVAAAVFVVIVGIFAIKLLRRAL